MRGRLRGAPGSGQPGENPFPAGRLAWRRPGPGRLALPATAARHKWVGGGLAGHGWGTCSYP